MAEKLEMMSKDIIQENIDYIANKFPNSLKEVKDENGNLVKRIDFDVLKQELSRVVIDDKQERYQMTWPDKKKSILLANSRINATLRPLKDKSVDFDNTKNLYIEGDNLNSLKLLRETYLGKVKMIYIDPPYNTGNNILYKNDFSQSTNEYLEISGQFDEEGNNLFQNTESNGRFHTEWLNILYPALKVARDLLADNGYIAIAIDDNELYNLKKICDEIFNEANYIGTIVTKCNPQGRNKLNIDPIHEYHLVYSKNINMMNNFRLQKEDKGEKYGYLMRSGTNSRKFERPLRYYPMLVKNNQIHMITKEEYLKIYANNRAFDEEWIAELTNKYSNQGYNVIFPISKDGEDKVWQREFDRVAKEYTKYIFENGQIKVPAQEDRVPVSLWSDEKYSNSSYGTNHLKKLFNGKSPFDFPKSIFTVRDLISLGVEDGDVVLDFFPGSATTAESLMMHEIETGKKIRFILIQLPEKCVESSTAYEMGYSNIPDIAEERIRRAGKRIKTESGMLANDLDVGFRVLKLDSSNMNDVYYNAKSTTQSLLESTVDNVKPDRTPLDLLFQVMLELGIELSAKIEEKEVLGKKYFIVNENDIVACFDDDVNNDVIKELAQIKPIYAVFRDSVFIDDPANINCEQLFKTISPSTTIKVL